MDGAAEIDWRWLTLTLTRSPAQKPAHKDPGRNDQTRVITPEAAYAPVSNRAGSRSLSITRSPAQKSACKELKRNGKAWPSRAPRRRDLRVRTLVAMAKDRPSRPRPLTLRSLTAPDRAHFLKGDFYGIYFITKK